MENTCGFTFYCKWNRLILSCSLNEIYNLDMADYKHGMKLYVLKLHQNGLYISIIHCCF